MLAAFCLFSLSLSAPYVIAQPASVPQLAEAPGIKLADLMRLLADQDHGEVRFRETRHFARLKEPIVITGILSFQKPDRLTKIVHQPRWERIDVVRNEVAIRTSKNESARVISLSEIPALNGMIVALRATLMGDEAQLTEAFALHLSGTRDEWRLDLVPRSVAIREKISQVAISGRSGMPSTFALTQRNGDRILIQIMER